MNAIASDDLPEISPTAIVNPEIVEVINEAAKKDGNISLLEFISQKSRKVFDGELDGNDKSANLTKLLKDLQGSHNWLINHSVPFLGNVDELTQLAGAKLGIDSAKVARIIKSINVAECVPARFYAGGDDACWKKVKELQKKTFKAQFQDISQRQAKLEEYKKRAKSLGLATTHLKMKEDSDELESGNIANILKVDEQLEGRLKFNEMRQEFELDGDTLDLDTCHFIIEAECGLALSKDKALDIVTFIGKKHGYSPVAVYLVENHKKVATDDKALSTIASDYFGCTDELSNIYMRKFMIGAVDRAMNPGQPNEDITILLGGQGVRKTTTWRTLANVIPDKNVFTSSLGSLDNKDDLAKLKFHWIIEMGEIDQKFRSKEVEEFKVFLSETTDTYRPPYGRRNIAVPRSCSFVGTSNRKNILRDSTGARRYRIIEIQVEVIDTERLKDNRDMLWASAYEAWNNGEKHHSEGEELKLTNERNRQYQEVETDPWMDLIQSYVGGRDWVATNDLYSPECLAIEVSRREQKYTHRITSIMKQLGFDSDRRRQAGVRVNGWAKVKPEPKSEVPKQPTVQTVVEPQPIVTPEPQPTAVTVSHTPNHPDFAKAYDINDTQSVINYIRHLVDENQSEIVGKVMVSLVNYQVKNEVLAYFSKIGCSEYLKECEANYEPF